MKRDPDEHAEAGAEPNQLDGPIPHEGGDQQTGQVTFGQIVAEIARTTTIVELGRSALAVAQENADCLPDIIEQLHAHLSAAKAGAQAAVNALDTALGFAPQDLEGIGKAFAELSSSRDLELEEALRHVTGTSH